MTPAELAAAPELNGVLLDINAAPLPQQQFDALQTLIPIVSGSLWAASEGPMRQIRDVIGDRLISVVAKETEEDEQIQAQERKKQAGFGYGDVAPLDNGAWIQVLGDEVRQHERHSVPGYKAQVLGLVIGRDFSASDQFTFGFAVGYEHAKVMERNSGGSVLEIDRFQGSVYGSHHFEHSSFYFNWIVTVAENDYDGHRHIVVPPFAGLPFVRIANADFDAFEFDAYLEAGYVWQKRNFRAIPKILFNYAYLNPESYFEQDAFGLDLFVQYDNMHVLPLGAGFKLDYKNEFTNVLVVPEAHAYVFYNIVNDKEMASALFTAGGFPFLSQGATPPPWSLELGLGLNVHSFTNTLISLHYDYVTKADYHRHQAFIKVRHEWA